MSARYHGGSIPSPATTIINTYTMNKYYITSDKVGEFVAKLYAAGVRVDIKPEENELCIHTDAGYEWVHVFSKGSFDELCAAFLPKTDTLNTEG